MINPGLPDILIEPVVRAALLEDLGRAGDVTADAVIPPKARFQAEFRARGHGVSVHRADCSTFRQMANRNRERVIDVEWGRPKAGAGDSVYAVDVAVEAADRQGLLRDISDVFAREKMNVIGVQTQSVRGTACMTFTIEIADTTRLAHVLAIVAGVQGVRWARRR